VDLEQLPEAVEALRSEILAFQTLKTAMKNVLADHDVTEAAVRARFEQHFKLTLEEFAGQHIKDNTIEGYVRRFKEANSDRHPSQLEHCGKRFYMIVDRRDGGEEKRWFRFLICHGLMAVVVDELTNLPGEIYEPTFIDDIAWQIGWNRWSHWDNVGSRPSRIFPESRGQR
jgi:hypothetical protein